MIYIYISKEFYFIHNIMQDRIRYITKKKRKIILDLFDHSHHREIQHM